MKRSFNALVEDFQPNGICNICGQNGTTLHFVNKSELAAHLVQEHKMLNAKVSGNVIGYIRAMEQFTLGGTCPVESCVQPTTKFKTLMGFGIHLSHGHHLQSPKTVKAEKGTKVRILTPSSIPVVAGNHQLIPPSNIPRGNMFMPSQQQVLALPWSCCPTCKTDVNPSWLLCPSCSYPIAASQKLLTAMLKETLR